MDTWINTIYIYSDRYVYIYPKEIIKSRADHLLIISRIIFSFLLYVFLSLLWKRSEDRVLIGINKPRADLTTDHTSIKTNFSLLQFALSSYVEHTYKLYIPVSRLKKIWRSLRIWYNAFATKAYDNFFSSEFCGLLIFVVSSLLLLLCAFWKNSLICFTCFRFHFIRLLSFLLPTWNMFVWLLSKQPSSSSSSSSISPTAAYIHVCMYMHIDGIYSVVRHPFKVQGNEHLQQRQAQQTETAISSRRRRQHAAVSETPPKSSISCQPTWQGCTTNRHPVWQGKKREVTCLLLVQILEIHSLDIDIAGFNRI